MIEPRQTAFRRTKLSAPSDMYHSLSSAISELLLLTMIAALFHLMLYFALSLRAPQRRLAKILPLLYRDTTLG
jgi:hypothetical protein